MLVFEDILVGNELPKPETELTKRSRFVTIEYIYEHELPSRVEIPKDTTVCYRTKRGIQCGNISEISKRKYFCR